MGIKELGQAISMQRKKLKMTQAELAEGICTQPALSSIEKGETTPTLENLFFLSLKLGNSLDDILFYLNESIDPTRVKGEINTIERSLSNQEYKIIQELADKEIKELEGTGEVSWYLHYLFWAKYLSDYKLNIIGYQKAIDLCKSLLAEEYSIINKMNSLSLRILNTIAFIHAENNNYDMSLMYFEKALHATDHLEMKHSMLSPELFRVKMLYNKAKTQYDLGLYDESIMTIQTGIRESKQKESMSLLGNFYYYLGQCYEKQEKEYQEIADAYIKAKHILEILDRKKYLKILNDLKYKYIKSGT
ncbi:helix-turn-helix domain-containing protein [Texcoconibacillus texcoconensis]|uniref:Transcriptional regulator with XRE-family HTH domain n=1 Tax=Texcoconibacillus texcoconensis TaxID=1095777 RepID=A0A840QTU9_9BACI|nr:helix-turn-helix domain-containing protein [Texcoconibacillus texcoconensis]MBB5174718.1 transcriptional regulator with XRE-family HTH domain [Texcoconibacillus texcoconensis]